MSRALHAYSAVAPEQAVPEGYMTGVHDGSAQQYGMAHAAGAYDQNAQLAYEQQMAQVCVLCNWLSGCRAKGVRMSHMHFAHGCSEPAQ